MKPFYKSKTIWLNTIVLTGSILLALAEQPWISDTAQETLLAIVALANVALRSITTESIRLH